MSVQELSGKVVADEHADVLRQAVVWLAQELMEAEVSQAAGASYGERNPERTARRNGYRQRAWDTRLGRSSLPPLAVEQLGLHPAQNDHRVVVKSPIELIQGNSRLALARSVNAHDVYCNAGHLPREDRP